MMPNIKLHDRATYYKQRHKPYLRINQAGQLHLSAGLVRLLNVQAGDQVCIGEDENGQYLISRTDSGQGFPLKQNKAAGAALHFNCMALVARLQEAYRLPAHTASNLLHATDTKYAGDGHPFYLLTKSPRQ